MTANHVLDIDICEKLKKEHVAACAPENSKCLDTGINSRSCICVPGTTPGRMDQIPDDTLNTTGFGPCLGMFFFFHATHTRKDIDRCAEGDVVSCGNVNNTLCVDRGINMRTCSCRVGYYGFAECPTGSPSCNPFASDSWLLTDDQNPFLGTCTGINSEIMIMIIMWYRFGWLFETQ